jgi:3-oxoacyl-[acyl-carrier protein] reductase
MRQVPPGNTTATSFPFLRELGQRNIRVHSINPGMVETEGVHAAGLAESDFRKCPVAPTVFGSGSL